MTSLLKEGRESCVTILKDIGIKLLSATGRGYLRVQEDVLSACDTLIAHQSMDAQQALQIQHLLLKDPEKIVPAFLHAQVCHSTSNGYHSCNPREDGVQWPFPFRHP